MITSLRLQNFRSYKDSSFEFEPGVNIVVGPNATGKTNLLEAIIVLSKGTSSKNKDIELIRHRSSWARVDGQFENHKRSLKIEAQEEKSLKTFIISDKPVKRMRLENTIPVVYFEPNHLNTITRGPEQRREFFDDLLERTQPGYKSLLANYRRTLAQRNNLVKFPRMSAEKQLFVWDIKLAELGAKIAEARHNLITAFNKELSRTYSHISQKKNKVLIEYKNQFPIESYASRMVSQLEKDRHKDFERGFTSSGPHREDIAFYLNKHPLGPHASRGETRSLMLALKSLEIELVERTRGQKPLFLLDDVFSELDGSRRRALVELLTNHQAILTTPETDLVVQYFSGKHKLIALK